MIEQIVSGGQTGVDQAALAMAVEASLAIGG
jgi:predicted Rossmann fold nucleotide-binding protein DprA/Smf involved in DNA uptake